MFSIHMFNLIGQYGKAITVKNILKYDTSDTDDGL